MKAICSLVTLLEWGPSHRARQGWCIHVSPGVPWGIWSPLRGTVARDWRAPVAPCCNGTVGSSWSQPTGGVSENFEEDTSMHRASRGTRLTQGPHLPGSKSYTVSAFFFPLKNSNSDYKKIIPVCYRIFTNYKYLLESHYQILIIHLFFSYY